MAEKKFCSCGEEAEFKRDETYYCGDHARGQIGSSELVDLGFEDLEDEDDT